MGHLEPYAATRHSRATADQPAACDAQPLVNCKLDERSSRTHKSSNQWHDQQAFCGILPGRFLSSLHLESARSSRTRKRLEEESSQLAFFVHEAKIPVLVNPEPE